MSETVERDGQLYDAATGRHLGTKKEFAAAEKEKAAADKEAAAAAKKEAASEKES